MFLSNDVNRSLIDVKLIMVFATTDSTNVP